MRLIMGLIPFVTFALFLSAVSAMTVNRKIVFPKFGPAPAGHEKYDPKELSAGATKIYGGKALPAPFRSFVKKSGGFTYKIKTKAAVYRVKFGFYEFSKCSKGARVFRMSANGKFTSSIDVFNEVGCKKPRYKVISGVQATGGVITIAGEAISGAAPFLANVQIVETGSLSAKPSPAAQSQYVVSIVFSKSAAPPGWKKFKPVKLDGGVKFATSSISTLAVPFRNAATKSGGFMYVQTLPPGTYRVILGFAEVTNTGCAKGKRVFKATVNNKGTAAIDTFKAVGCKKPHTRALGGVVVGSNRKLTITVIPISGFAPFLANFRVVRLNTSPTDPSPNPNSPSSPAPSVKPPGGSQKLVQDLDTGGASDVKGAITGTTTIYSNVFPIAGTTQDARYSRHRFGMEFMYVLSVKPNILYNVKVFFAESYEPGCKDGFRVFDVFVYDGGKTQSSGKALRNLDVFKAAGCRTAYSRSINGIGVGASGKIAVGFKSSVNNAMISAIQITTSDGTFVPQSPNASPPPTTPSLTAVEINAGGPGDKFIPGTKKEITTSAVSKTASVSAAALKTARVGTDFVYSFNLEPGAYDVMLAFSENFGNFCSEPAKRVFNVFINDLIQLEGFDIFEQAGGCRKGVEILLKGHTVGAVDTQPLTLKFSGIVSNAQINYIRIKKASQTCVPASTTGKLSSDHAAHSVPGSYPPQFGPNSPKTYVDADGDGFVSVKIDGDGSHSHFFDSANNVIGVITDYTWSIMETNKVLSRQKTFTYKFPLGTTRLRLSVTDNSCTSDEAETTVTVTGAIQPGQYCYYYAGLDDLPKVGSDSESQKPQFSAVTTSMKLGFPSFSFSTTKFAARCKFFLEVDKDSASSTISVATFGSGLARVYKGEDLIIDSASASSADTSLAVGLIGFEVVYLRTSLAKPAKLHFLVNNAVPAASKISHDRKMVIPILTSVTPSEGPIGGGTKVKVNGYGLFSPLSVKFGQKTVPVLESGRSPTQFFVNSPKASKAGTVQITATSGSGVKSNAVGFSYGGSCDSIGFTRTVMLKANGKELDTLELPTSAVIGQDGKIYLGTLGGTVQVVGYNTASLKTTSHCYSKALKDAKVKKNGIPAVRDILAVTFDPRDKVIRPYVSSSTMFWFDRDRVDRSNKEAWSNGAVDRLKPGTDPTDSGVCLVYDKRIVSGLPVSNHDHSVNGLLFTQSGDLLINVGGYTNMGLPGYKLGGYWETHLSAAILLAKLSKPGFMGQIKYKFPNEPRKAKMISGDVELFVTGLRNTFSLTMTGKGEIYATDNGPNCSFGDTSAKCSDYDEAKAAAWNPDASKDWQGKVKHGWQSCPYSLSRPDKILHITKGSWYGHPNINRGGGECAWIDPEDDLTADDKPAPGKYKKPMVILKSPLTGIAEYRSNHFCGKLRGELVLSTYKSGTTWRMGVNGGTVTSGPDEIATDGGITFVENAHGDLIFPRLSEKNVFVLKPKVTAAAGVFVAGAVPFRHGKQGGTKIIIGGSNFGTKPTVTIGTKKCTVTKSSNTEISCTVPAHTGGLKSLTVKTTSGTTADLADAVLYMNV